MHTLMHAHETVAVSNRNEKVRVFIPEKCPLDCG